MKHFKFISKRKQLRYRDTYWVFKYQHIETGWYLYKFQNARYCFWTADPHGMTVASLQWYVRYYLPRVK